MAKGVRRILVRGSMPPCHLRWRKFWKFEEEYSRRRVMINNNNNNNSLIISLTNQSSLVSLHPHPNPENCLFSCFRFLIFHPFFPGVGVSWPHLSLCADAHGWGMCQGRGKCQITVGVSAYTSEGPTVESVFCFPVQNVVRSTEIYGFPHVLTQQLC